jgi:hypothetical protein
MYESEETMNIHQIAADIQRVALLENTELGDYLKALVDVNACGKTCASEEFMTAIEKELVTMHAWVFEAYEIVEVTEARTETRKVLRWKEEE